MNSLYEPILVKLDISHVEEYFPIYCPVCGHEVEYGNSDKYCPHLVIDYTPGCEFISESIQTKKGTGCYDSIQEILEIGAKEPLMIFETWSYSLDGGETFYTGMSLKEWEDQGVAIT